MRTVTALILLGLVPALSIAFEAADLLDYSGQELFDRFCASCHGDSGRGDGPVAFSLAIAVPDLTRITERYGGQFPADRVYQTIDGRVAVEAHGTRPMPVWGYEFWTAEGADAEAEAQARTIINRLVEYVRSIQRTPRAVQEALPSTQRRY
ncbi:MAG TPA: c-type cytochrome [Gammaproteobacteria bacterium]|nr:c-type cytochrome [Gammaproteobacteria bacterium]